MATQLQFVENFPVRFNWINDNECDCDDRPFCQLAQWTDPLNFYFYAGTTDVDVYNPNFSTGLYGWAINNGLVPPAWTSVSNKAHLSNSLQTLSQTISMISVGKTYKITFTLSGVTGTGTFRVTLGGASYDIVNPNNGTYTVYLYTVTTGDLVFQSLTATLTLDLDTITIEEKITNYLLTIVNTSTGQVGTTKSFTSATNNLGLYLETTWNAMGLSSDGCYKIGLVDPAAGLNLVVNGGFARNLNSWTVVTSTATWTWNSGTALLAGGTLGDQIKQTLSGLINGHSYTMYFTGSGYLSGTLGVSFLQDAVNASYGVSLNGAHSITATYNSSSIDTNKSGIIFEPVAGSNSYQIDDVVVIDNGVAPNHLSECYKLADSFECTNLLKWVNDKPGFDIIYTGTKSSYEYWYMRIQSYLVNSKYPAETNKYIDSGGNQKLYYGSNIKQKELRVVEMVEYMHDALATGLLHTDFYIGSTRYSWEESDYNPEWGGDNNYLELAKSNILLRKFTDDNKNLD